VTQHSGLTEERWRSFTLDQKILMIANEMNRASAMIDAGDALRTRNCYERVLHLTDLTIRTENKSNFRRELLRWRDLIAELYVSEGTDRLRQREAFRCLLYFTPEASLQIRDLGGRV
jgi:hypothetical protein